MHSFYGRLRYLRLQHNKTIKQVAEATGLSYRTIQSYELQDRAPAVIDALITLARYFNVSIDYLVGETDNPKRYDEITIDE